MRSYIFVCFAYVAVWISPAHSLGESLSLDYQNIYPSYGQDAVELGLMYDGACSHFVVEMFTRQDIIDGGNSVLEGHNSTVGSSSVNISLEVFNQTQPVYVRIVAASEDGNICSDDQSQQLYYHFVAPGREEILGYEPSVEVPIPTTHCDHPVVVWPRTSTSNRDHCYCLSLRNSVYSFEDCVEACQTHHNVTFNGSSIFFHDLNMMSDSFVVHFVCDEAPCSQTSCTLETVVASYRISLNIGTSPTYTSSCNGFRHFNGCCIGQGPSDCSVEGENGVLCYCDVECYAHNNCCDDIRDIDCFPSSCAEAGKLNCSISEEAGAVERCGVEVARDTYCFCNVNCEDQCCYDGIIAASIATVLTAASLSLVVIVFSIIIVVIGIIILHNIMKKKIIDKKKVKPIHD